MVGSATGVDLSAATFSLIAAQRIRTWSGEETLPPRGLGPEDRYELVKKLKESDNGLSLRAGERLMFSENAENIT
jgi:hypothetical protein